MIHACYGSGCPYEKPNGECKKAGWVSKCPIDMTEEEAEEEAYWAEYWQDMKAEEQRECCS